VGITTDCNEACSGNEYKITSKSLSTSCLSPMIQIINRSPNLFCSLVFYWSELKKSNYRDGGDEAIKVSSNSRFASNTSSDRLYEKNPLRHNTENDRDN